MNNQNNGIATIVPEKFYHYTAFEKFCSIIEYGTLRFKLSTASNDLLDTKYIVDVISRVIAKQKKFTDLKRQNFNSFVLGFFVRPEYQHAEQAYVTCFSSSPDSRLLWDAYTVNRPTSKCKHGEELVCFTSNAAAYNGVCLCINRDIFYTNLRKNNLAQQANEILLGPIWYESNQQDEVIRRLLEEAWQMYHAKKLTYNDNNNDSPLKIRPPGILINGEISIVNNFEINIPKSFYETMLWFISGVQRCAPFIKHEFWEEEKEYRAALFRKTIDMGLSEHIHGNLGEEYIDIPVKEEIFDAIITGPTFGQEEESKLESILNAKLDFRKISVIPSKGTGIIRNK